MLAVVSRAAGRAVAAVAIYRFCEVSVLIDVPGLHRPGVAIRSVRDLLILMRVHLDITENNGILRFLQGTILNRIKGAGIIISRADQHIAAAGDLALQIVRFDGARQNQQAVDLERYIRKIRSVRKHLG